MAVDLYLYDEGKKPRGVALWGIQKLIHDERDFQLTAELLNSYKVRSGEHLGFMCDDGRFRLFKAERAVVHTNEGFTTVTATESAVAELARSVIYEVRCTDEEGNEIKYDADELAQMVLAGSGFELGKRAKGRKASVSQYCAKRWRALRDIESACNVRIIPYYEISGGQIVRRVVDIEEKTYQRTGRILQRETDETNIQITYADNAIARLYGIGASIGTEDPPTCVTFGDAEWSVESGDPMDKPAGQMYLENPDVLAMGIVDEDVFEDKNITDPIELLEATRKALLERSRPKVSGVATAFDVGHIPGYEHKRVQMYNILDVPDDNGGTVEGVIVDIQRNYIHRERTQIVIGDEQEDQATISKMVAKLLNKTTNIGKSAGAASNRYIENKHLIMLNANRIILNADEILAHAKEIELTASNLEEYKKGTDGRLTTAELLLYGDGTTANAGLYAKVGENAAAVSAVASELGSKVSIDALDIELRGYVTASKFEAEIAKIDNFFAGNSTAAKLVVTNLNALSMTFDGLKVKWKNLSLSGTIPVLSGYNVRLADGGTMMLYAFNGTNRNVSISGDGFSVLAEST